MEKNLPKIIKNKTFSTAAVFLLIGIFLGFVFTTSPKSPIKVVQSCNTTGSDTSTEVHAGAYKLINPLYECNNRESYGVKEFSDLENILNNTIDKITSKNSVTRVSVYFRDLNNGPWFGINEKDDFAPSSLLKLPVMMAYFKNAQDDPSILTKLIKYNADPKGLIAQNFKPNISLEKGKSYTVEYLIERMIEGSDNVALGLLEDNIAGADVDKVTQDLGIPTATINTPNDFMNVRNYSGLFRVLFNSSYLNRNYSEKALEILSKSEFQDGLVKEIPSNIVVSHKFGERNQAGGLHQLHDCGIVYYPKRPYLICIMTKGQDFSDLVSTIDQISKKVYSEVSTRYPVK